MLHNKILGISLKFEVWNYENRLCTILTGYNETMCTSEDFEIHVKITMTVILKCNVAIQPIN